MTRLQSQSLAFVLTIFLFACGKTTSHNYATASQNLNQTPHVEIDPNSDDPLPKELAKNERIGQITSEFTSLSAFDYSLILPLPFQNSPTHDSVRLIHEAPFSATKITDSDGYQFEGGGFTKNTDTLFRVIIPVPEFANVTRIEEFKMTFKKIRKFSSDRKDHSFSQQYLCTVGVASPECSTDLSPELLNAKFNGRVVSAEFSKIKLPNLLAQLDGGALFGNYKNGSEYDLEEIDLASLFNLRSDQSPSTIDPKKVANWISTQTTEYAKGLRKIIFTLGNQVYADGGTVSFMTQVSKIDPPDAPSKLTHGATDGVVPTLHYEDSVAVQVESLKPLPPKKTFKKKRT